jgi:hypothetical protein
MYRYHCSCGYGATVAGGERSEDGVRTATMVCSSCRELVDVVQAGGAGRDGAGRCPRCDSRYQRPWTDRSCPRCMRTMSRSQAP